MFNYSTNVMKEHADNNFDLKAEMLDDMRFKDEETEEII